MEMMDKAWNKTHGSFFRSFHLEVLALEVLNNVRITDFPSGVRFFFDKVRTNVRGKNLDPAGYGDDIGRYINSTAKVSEAVALPQGRAGTHVQRSSDEQARRPPPLELDPFKPPKHDRRVRNGRLP
jgi:hypothetical protein